MPSVVERLEDALAHLQRQAVPTVGDDDPYASLARESTCALARPHREASARSHDTKGVADQIL